jgi:hypothetical protein
VAAFVAVLAAALGIAEYHCRSSPRFSSEGQFHIRRFMLADPTHAVFGDSQVGWGPLLPGFAFLSTAAQQPPELVRLVHYFYAVRRPKKVILQAAPQWFGHYHVNRPQLITDDALPFRYVNLLVSSAHFHRPLKEHLLQSLGGLAWSSLTPRSARADARPSVELPTDGETANAGDAWLAEVKRDPSYTRFNWSKLADDKRKILTAHRVYAQNPRTGFEVEAAARQYEEAIEYLIGRGARICLFRTAVTADYQDMTARIHGSNFAAFDRYIHQIARRYDLRYVDYRELDYRFGDDRFQNQDHMRLEPQLEFWPLVERACFRG